jgi:hypothetical protein
MKTFYSVLLALSLVAVVGAVQAQESPLLLPSGSVIMQSYSGGPTDIVLRKEETGLVSYSGRGCNDASTGYWEESGKAYGNNEWAQVFADVTRYGASMRDAFQQMMQFAHPSEELAEAEEEARSSSDHGNTVSRDVSRLDIPHGEVLLTRDVIGCIMDQHDSYEHTTFQAFAVAGTTIVNIRGSYNSGDPGVAVNICSEVVQRATR